MSIRSGLIAAVIMAIAVLPAAAFAAPVTIKSLLAEMIDRDAQARAPLPAYRCLHASSYDRKSVTPDVPDNWFANDDWSQFVRVEATHGRREWVMLDADGPGAIVRIWWGGMFPKSGVMRFYFDGSESPAVEAPAVDLLIGKALTGYPLAIENAHGIPGAPGGMNLFLPIPFARHCKITWDGPNYWETKAGEDMRWYNIEYRSYAPGTPVQTFTMQHLRDAAAQIESVEQTLTHHAVESTPPLTSLSPLLPGQSATISLPLGPHAVRELRMKVDPATGSAADFRAVFLRMVFDGVETVRCPITDFFGSGAGINPLESWTRTVTADGAMTCRFVMPYHRAATIVVENTGKNELKFSYDVETGSWHWDSRSLYFHSNWRHQDQIPTRPHSDWNYLTAAGQGTYVGDTLTVNNPVPDWWGEGDEKIYVDGERFPSHFGTGSEDYYGYSWGNTTLFQGPFSNQVRVDGPGNKGVTVVTRTRSLDAIPFSRGIRFDMEIWHWADVRVGYSVATYWYGAPGAVRL